MRLQQKVEQPGAYDCEIQQVLLAMKSKFYEENTITREKRECKDLPIEQILMN